ncbi:MAG: ATP synthase subunit I [Desulfobacterales bacterium]
MMESVRETQKRYCSGAMAAAVLIGLALILFGRDALGKGLILGTFFSIVNFVIIGETLSWRNGKSQARTFGISLGSITLRFALMAAPLFVAIKYDRFNLITTIIGLFMVQLAILADHVIGTAWMTPGKKI